MRKTAAWARCDEEELRVCIWIEVLVYCFANGNHYALSDASTIEVLDFHARCSANRTLR